jgi:hypothetical protein
MHNAVAQSATILTKSANGEANYDFELVVKGMATQQAKGVTRERQMLNRQKLISKVCANYRATFAEIYGKSDRLPSDVFVKVEAAVDSFLTKQLSAITTTNIISQRKSFFVNRKDMSVTERVFNVGENALALKEQHLGINLFIGQVNRSIAALEKMPDNSNVWKEERLSLLNERLNQLEVVKIFIEREIANQQTVAK